MRYLVVIMNRKTQSTTLPMGFADQVMDLEMRLQDEETLQIMQILIQLYRIGVDYYLQSDLKKATYLQKKLNSLIVRCLNIQQEDKRRPARQKLNRKVREEVQKISQYQNTYITTLVQQSQKSQKRIKDCVLADLNKQEENLQSRMLKRVKSSDRL